MLNPSALTPADLRLIGCSDYAPALGLKEPGPVGLYNRVRHGIETPRKGLEEMGELGKLIEMPTAVIMARKLGLDETRIEKIPTIQHPGGREWARVSFDPIVRSPAHVFEIKSRAGWRLAEEGWGDAGTDDVPLPVWMQVQGQMEALTADRDHPRWRGTELPDVEVVHVGVLVNGIKVLIFPVPRARDLGAELAERMRKFWVDHVQRGIPPVMDHFEGSAHYLRTTYTKRSKVIRKAEEHEIEAINDYRHHAAKAAYYDDAADALKHEVLEIIGNDNGIKGPGFKLSIYDRAGFVRHKEVADVLAKRLGISAIELKQLEENHRGEPSRVLKG